MGFWLSMTPRIEQGRPFRSRPRTEPIDTFVLHDSAGANTTRESTIGTLLERGGGTYFIVESDGSITQHVPVDRATGHAGHLNDESLALDSINAVDPRGAKLRPGQRVIKAAWMPPAWGGVVQDSPEQAESIYRLVRWAVEHHGVVDEYPGAYDGYWHWTGGIAKLSEARTENGGILAHGQTSTQRADGLTAALYCFLRDQGHGAKTAYELVAKMSANAEQVKGQHYRSPIPPRPSNAWTLLLAVAVVAGVIWKRAGAAGAGLFGSGLVGAAA